MSYAEERALIEARWATQWVEGGSPRTPTRFETLPGFVPPEKAPWAALYILGGESGQASTGAPGSNYWRTASAIKIQIFVPMVVQGAPIAARRADMLADHAIRIFRGWAEGPIRCGAPWKGSYSEDPPWLMATINVPLSRDDIG